MRFMFTMLLLLGCSSSDTSTPTPAPAPTTPVTPEVKYPPAHIAFGSCAEQDKAQPILTTVVGKKPDLFMYLGDNIYGDTEDMGVLQGKYDKLAAKPEFQALRSAVPILSVWDDHDYGSNDAGKEYAKKAESKQIFMDFWKVPEVSPRRMHEGIYGSERFESGGKTLQIVLLDTRWFRDALKFSEGPPNKNDYQPDADPTKTLLGEAQWQWLDAELRKPADVRILVSSIQFAHAYNGYESWNNLPLEQTRMVRTLRTTGAKGVVFLSGDVHWGEISVRKFDEGYPLIDVTSSGLTEEWPRTEANMYRIGDPVSDNNFGMLDIDWKASDPTLSFQLIDVNGQVRASHQVKLSALQ